MLTQQRQYALSQYLSTLRLILGYTPSALLGVCLGGGMYVRSMLALPVWRMLALRRNNWKTKVYLAL